jgi:hypothetical protein
MVSLLPETGDSMLPVQFFSLLIVLCAICGLMAFDHSRLLFGRVARTRNNRIKVKILRFNIGILFFIAPLMVYQWTELLIGLFTCVLELLLLFFMGFFLTPGEE